MSTRRIDVSEAIDRSSLSGLQIVVISLCTLCMMVDGFDVQAMSYVAPDLIKTWGVAKAELGPVFGAGLVGMALGAIALGLIADRIGRRVVLICAFVGLAAAMFATAHAASVRELLALRFAAGLAMGAIIPNAVALAGEFSPGRMRVVLMMIPSSGFILGGVAGGTVAATLIPMFGWPSVFLVGAITPLLLAVAMFVWMPESVQFLVLRGRHLARARRTLQRIAPQAVVDAEAELVVPERAQQAPIRQLFRDSLGTGTVLLWAANFMNLLAVYFLANWLPVIMNDAGHRGSQAVLAGTIFWIGGFIGNLLLGWIVERRGFGSTLVATFLVATLAVAMIGQTAASFELACLVIAVAGFCVLGGQSGLNTLAGMYYPTAARSTGIGWSLGVGRMGSILGPTIGGVLMQLNWSTPSLFVIAAFPALLAALALLAFWLSGRLPATRSTATVAIGLPARIEG